MFCTIALNSKVIVKTILDPDDYLTRNLNPHGAGG